MNPISLPITELKSALLGLGKVIGKRSTLPVFSHVRIERTRHRRVELAASDLDYSAAIRFDAPAEGEPLALLVPFDQLSRITKGARAPEDLLVLAPADAQHVLLRFPVGGQNIEHCCESLPVEEFPPLPEFPGEAARLDPAIPVAIQQAAGCSSTDETRYILNGVCLDVSQPGAHHIVATDGRHLFSANSFTLPLAESLVIPNHQFLEWKELRNDGPWKLRVAKPENSASPKFEISTEHWRFAAAAIEGTYPNWRQVVPNDSGTRSTITFEAAAAEKLIEIITRLPDLERVNHGLGLAFSRQNTGLLVSAGDGPRTRIEVEGVEVQGQEVTVHLNRDFLVKALRFGLFQLKIIDPLSPLRFHSGGRQLIVMPIRPASDPIPAKINPPAVSRPPAPNSNPPPRPADSPQEDITMPTNHTTNGAGDGASSEAETCAASRKPPLETALAKIESIKGSYREAVRGLNDLAEVIKQAQRENKSTEKEISSVRQTIRQIQAVRI